MNLTRRIIYAAVAAIAALAPVSCQNDGYIGRLFGTWRINSYTVDGTPIDEYIVRNTTISFQSHIVDVVGVADRWLTSYSRYGTWREERDYLILDFTHSDSVTDSGTGLYRAPEWLGMSSAAPMAMKITDSRSDSFTLTWTNDSGAVNEYRLEKTW